MVCCLDDWKVGLLAALSADGRVDELAEPKAFEMGGSLVAKTEYEMVDCWVLCLEWMLVAMLECV